MRSYTKRSKYCICWGLFSVAVGQRMLDLCKINYIVMKKRIGQCNSVSHWCVFISFWETMEVCGKEECRIRLWLPRQWLLVGSIIFFMGLVGSNKYKIREYLICCLFVRFTLKCKIDKKITNRDNSERAAACLSTHQKQEVIYENI